MGISEEKNFISTISRNRSAPKGAQEGCTAIVSAPDDKLKRKKVESNISKLETGIKYYYCDIISHSIIPYHIDRF